MLKIERRQSYELLKLKEEEIAAQSDSAAARKRYINGYAIVFNEMSEVIYNIYTPNGEVPVREIILPEAIDMQTVNSSDIKMLLNHDRRMGLLARSNKGVGTLSISIDERGVFFEFEVPDTQAGNDTWELIQRGDMGKASFAFTIAENGRQIEEAADGFIQKVSKIEALYDFSIVDDPAYDETSVEASKRSLEKYMEERNEKNEKKPENEALKNLLRVKFTRQRLNAKYKFLK